jgi:hypothetical protein
MSSATVQGFVWLINIAAFFVAGMVAGIKYERNWNQEESE